MKRLALLLMLWAAPLGAVEPDEVLDDPVLEARAREVSKGLRCLVCRNESIDESNASLARDLRILLRDRLVAGDTDQEAVDFMCGTLRRIRAAETRHHGCQLVVVGGRTPDVAAGWRDWACLCTGAGQGGWSRDGSA